MLTVRPITAGELHAFCQFAATEDRGFAPATPESFESWLADLWSTGQSRPDLCFVAERDGLFIAAIVYWRRDNRYHLEHLRLPAECDADLVELLRQSLAAIGTLGGSGAWAQNVSLAPDEPSSARLTAALTAIGFKQTRQRLQMSCPTDSTMPIPTDCIFRSLPDFGQSPFLAVWAEALADSLDVGFARDRIRLGPAEHAARSFASAQTMKHDPATWEIACDAAGSPKGVVIPGRIGSEPVIYFYGVLPAHRCKGVGRVLLLRGIQSLANTGAQSVRVDVDIANTPSVRAILSAGFQQVRAYSWYELEMGQ